MSVTLGCKAAPRPEFPTAFDAPTVQKLIDSLETPPNAMILRSGYFMRRGAHPLATEDGFKLLQGAAEKAPKDGKRWFVLENVIGFAAFRLPAADAEAGFAAYDTVFAHADKAGAAEALYTMRQSINDYLFSVQGKFGDLRLKGDERTTKTLGAAWAAYASVLAQEVKTKPKYVAPEPMWAQAIEAANVPEGFDGVVEKTISDPAVPKSFALYKAAASALEGSKPTRTVELLRQARPLVPKDDLNEAAWYFGKLVDILERQASSNDKGEAQPLNMVKLGYAILAQEDMVKTTGRGQTRVAELRFKTGDEKAYANLVTELSAANAPEREIIAAGELLGKKSGEPGKARADENNLRLRINLLEAYLKAARERDLFCELKARRMLGLTYLDLKQPDAARTAFKTDHLVIAPNNAQARSEWGDIQRILKRLDEQSKANPA